MLHKLAKKLGIILAVSLLQKSVHSLFAAMHIAPFGIETFTWGFDAYPIHALPQKNQGICTYMQRTILLKLNYSCCIHVIDTFRPCAFILFTCSCAVLAWHTYLPTGADKSPFTSMPNSLIINSSHANIHVWFIISDYPLSAVANGFIPKENKSEIFVILNFIKRKFYSHERVYLLFTYVQIIFRYLNNLASSTWNHCLPPDNMDLAITATAISSIATAPFVAQFLLQLITNTIFLR